MSKIVVDARGCGCPEPVLKTKRATAKGASELQVLVDNNTAKENVKRYAGSQGYAVTINEVEDGYELLLTK